MKYLRVTYKNGQVSSQIIAAAKTRVSPVKVITIPRLELMSSLLLVRLVHSVYSALTRRFLILKLLCLTGSAIRLTWIQNEKKRCNQFVQNCVRDLGGYVRDMWYHLPGIENIADLPSTGCFTEELLSKRSNWINGPSWLSQLISTWPISKGINRFTNKEEEEFIKTEIQTSAVSTIIATKTKSTTSVENVIDQYRYNTSKKILSVIATCVRFINSCHRKCQKMSGEISAEELNTAKKLCIFHLQKTFSSSVEFKIDKVEENYHLTQGCQYCFPTPTTLLT